MAILTDDNYVDKAENVIKSLNHTKDHRNNKIKVSILFEIFNFR